MTFDCFKLPDASRGWTFGDTTCKFFLRRWIIEMGNEGRLFKIEEKKTLSDLVSWRHHAMARTIISFDHLKKVKPQLRWGNYTCGKESTTYFAFLPGCPHITCHKWQSNVLLLSQLLKILFSCILVHSWVVPTFHFNIMISNIIHSPNFTNPFFVLLNIVKSRNDRYEDKDQIQKYSAWGINLPT